MNIWMGVMIGFLMANILVTSISLMREFGLFENRSFQEELEFAVMNANLLFKKKILVKPHLEYYSHLQATEHFYLLRTYRCSHERYFKLISGSYTTIVPEHGILEIDGKPFKTQK